MVLSENNKKLEIGGNDPKERAYHYKVLYPCLLSACHDVHTVPAFLYTPLSFLSPSTCRPCLWHLACTHPVFVFRCLEPLLVQNASKFSTVKFAASSHSFQVACTSRRNA